MARVLIVDDDFDILDALRGILETTYDVDVAANGAEALRKLAGQTYDAIVLDLMMPVMDGETFLRTLRANGSKVPVVIASAGANLAGVTQNAGANDFVSKPFDVTVLEEKLARLIGGSGSAGSSGGGAGGSGNKGPTSKPGPQLSPSFTEQLVSALLQRPEIGIGVPAPA